MSPIATVFGTTFYKGRPVHSEFSRSLPETAEVGGSHVRFGAFATEYVNKLISLAARSAKLCYLEVNPSTVGIIELWKET